MPFICPICKELLLSGYTSESTRDSVSETTNLVTTKCGHLFHESCLTTLFETKAAAGQYGEEPNPILSKSFCPSCHRIVLTQNLIPIYPYEDEEDHFGKLFARCNSLVLQNEELRKENDVLKVENDEFWKVQEALKLENRSSSASPSALSLEDRVLWFPDVSSDESGYKPEVGIVKWIDRKKEILYAGIEFENPIGNDEALMTDVEKELFQCKPKHGRIVPVNELILYCDFYYGSSPPPPKPQAFVSKPKPETSSPIPVTKPIVVQKKINEFEKQLNDFISLQESAAAEFRVLQDGVTRLTTEDIIGVPSAIEDQLKRSSEIQSDLVSNDRLIQNLKQLSVVILQYDDITTQEISILKEGISSLERIRDAARQNLARLQFQTALVHSQNIKGFLQTEHRWLDVLESQFEQLIEMETFDNLEVEPKLTANELLTMKLDLEFRQPHIEHLFASYCYFQTPGFKLKKNDEACLKAVLDRFDLLKRQKRVLTEVILKEANRIFKTLNAWCEQINHALETEFGSELLVKLQELAKDEEEIKLEIPKLMDLKNALNKDSIVGLEELSRNFENMKVKMESTCGELKSEIKQLKSKPALPKAYY